jgi:hypothetical protein
MLAIVTGIRQTAGRRHDLAGAPLIAQAAQADPGQPAARRTDFGDDRGRVDRGGARVNGRVSTTGCSWGKGWRPRPRLKDSPCRRPTTGRRLFCSAAKACRYCQLPRRRPRPPPRRQRNAASVGGANQATGREAEDRSAVAGAGRISALDLSAAFGSRKTFLEDVAKRPQGRGVFLRIRSSRVRTFRRVRFGRSDSASGCRDRP